jgi:hypothetical protein
MSHPALVSANPTGIGKSRRSGVGRYPAQSRLGNRRQTRSVTLGAMALVSHQGDLTKLHDGTEVLIGRLTPADAPLLADAFTRLSEESRRLRFLGPQPDLSPSELRYLTQVDGHQHEAPCAIDPATGRGVGVGRFVRDPADPTRAEVAITVTDDWQRRGVGKLPPHVCAVLRGLVPLALPRR